MGMWVVKEQLFTSCFPSLVLPLASNTTLEKAFPLGDVSVAIIVVPEFLMLFLDKDCQMRGCFSEN